MTILRTLRIVPGILAAVLEQDRSDDGNSGQAHTFPDLHSYTADAFYSIGDLRDWIASAGGECRHVDIRYAAAVPASDNFAKPRMEGRERS